MGRYHSNKLMDRRSRKPVFEAEFIVADCCQVNIARHLCYQSILSSKQMMVVIMIII